MKPDFALSLSTDGICLLERADPEWIILGQVDLTDSNFETRVSKLRCQALAKSPDADQVKLVIPNEQIKYYSLARPADTLTAEIETLITQSLAQETPYPVSEIAFDWVTSREHIFVAAVTLQTLKEAEYFAKEQGFKPLGNVSIPPANKFIGESFFGLSDGNQTKMVCDLEKISIANTFTKEIGNKHAKTNSHSKSLTSPNSQTAAQQQVKINTSVPIQTTLEYKAENILFQSVRNVELRQVKDELVDKGKSTITLIAPIDQNIPQALASFKSQNRTSTPFFSRLANLLYGDSLGQDKDKNHNRLMNAGFLPAFILFLTTVSLVSTGLFYLTKPTLWKFAEQFIGLPAGPELTIKLVQPRNLNDQEQKFILSHKFTQLPRGPKKFISSPLLLDLTGKTENPYADLNSARPAIGEQQDLARKFVFKPDLNKRGLVNHYALDNMIPLQRKSDTVRLEAPEQDSKFLFIEEKQHRIYASTGIWSFSPKVPHYMRSTNESFTGSFSKAANISRSQHSTLESLKNFEPGVKISTSEMPPKVVVSQGPNHSLIAKLSSDNIAKLDKRQKSEPINGLLPKKFPTSRRFLLEKSRSRPSLQNITVSKQKLIPAKKPKLTH
ncbi:MAG: hypothetical protein CL532_09520, partial [Aestuariivita sp.]|nr:hypothetical protein [Aestuariivita sp.]